MVNRYTDSDNSVVAQQGVNLHFENGKMNFYGFKGFEICKMVVTPRSVSAWEDILIPTQSVKCFINCINDSDIVDICHDGQKLELKTSEVSIIALGLDVKYPNVENFYKNKPLHKVKHNTVQFLRALKRLKPFAREESPLLILDIKTTTTFLSAEDVNYSRGGVEELDAIAELDCRCGINVNFMINALESFGNDEFYIYYNSEKDPIHIEPADMTKENDKFILLALMLVNS